MTEPSSSAQPETAEEPVITELDGFSDLVRNPDTGMIIPQTRRERKALDAAIEKVRARQAGTDSVHQPIEVIDRAEFYAETTSADAHQPAGENHTPATEQYQPAPEAPVAAQPVSEQPVAPKASRAGRDLPAAIGMGVLLLGAAIVGILWLPSVLAVLVAVLLVLGTWELHQVLKKRRLDVPLIPLWVGSLALPTAAYFAGIDAVVFALFGVILLAVFWVLLEDIVRPAATALATIFILVWVPFLLSFGILLLREDNGSMIVATFLLVVVSSDIFGYLFGVLWGKHAMAPKISPKKSWEGYAGSSIGAGIVGVLCFIFMLDEPWWLGLIFGLVLVVAGTCGDFAASMFKRDLGVKDYGKTIPGHGGVMDRLDSIVFAAPVAYTSFVLLMA